MTALLVIYILIIIYLFTDPPRPNFAMSLQYRSEYSLLLWFTLSVLIQVWYDDGEKPDNLSLIYVGLGAINILVMLYFSENLFMWYFIKTPSISTASEDAFSKYIYTMAIAIERSSNPDCMRYLHGAIKNYQQDLVKSDPHFRMSDYLKPLIDFVLTTPIRDQNISNEIKIRCYKLLVEIINRHKTRLNKNTYIWVMSSYVMHLKLNLKWKAIYEIQDIYANSQDFRVRYSSDVFIRQVEHEMIEAELRKREISHIDVVGLIEYQKRFAEFNQLLGEAFESYSAFWTQLASNKPVVKTVKRLGTKIIHTNQSIKTTFDLMMERTGNQVKTITLYGNYMKLVVNDIEESDKILSRAKALESAQAGRSTSDDKRLKYSDASNLCIVMASADQSSMGIIKSVNSETLKFFDYTSDELLGRNVDVLMPKVFADNHDRWMRRYFDRNEERVLNTERRVFGNTKNGYVMVCQLFVKTMTDIRNEVHVVGLLTKDTQASSCCLLIDFNTGVLLGVTEKCFSRFGLNNRFCYSKGSSNSQVNIAQLFPQVQSPADLVSSKELGGRVTLDTTLIHSFSADAVQTFISEKKVNIEVYKKHDVKISDSRIWSFDDDKLKIIEMYVRQIKARKESFVVQEDVPIPLMDDEMKYTMSPYERQRSLKSAGLGQSHRISVTTKLQIQSGAIPIGPASIIPTQHSPEEEVEEIMDQLDEEEIQKENARLERIRKYREIKIMSNQSQKTKLIILFDYLGLSVMILPTLCMIGLLYLQLQGTGSLHNCTWSIYYQTQRHVLINDLSSQARKLNLSDA